ncbi:hypothetical protein COJ07_01085 [Bacillus cereus]|nr:hypothetical protein COJ07_01085 [Bacillus cereus]
MILISDDSVDNLFMKSVELVLEKGDNVKFNGSEYLIVYSAILNIKDTQKKYISNPLLGINYINTLIEFIMTINNYGTSYTERYEIIKNFKPRNLLLDLEDLDLRQGNAIFNWNGKNQLFEVYNILDTSLQTSRAIMSFLEPQENIDVLKKNGQPCQHWWQFIYKDGKLHLNACFRSISLVKGFSVINYYELSMILQLMSNWLNIEPGEINIFTGQLVLEKRNLKFIKKSLVFTKDNNNEINSNLIDKTVDITRENLFSDTAIVLDILKSIDELTINDLEKRLIEIKSAFLIECTKLIYIDYLVSNRIYNTATELYLSVEESELKAICSLTYLNKIITHSNQENSELYNSIIKLTDKYFQRGISNELFENNIMKG